MLRGLHRVRHYIISTLRVFFVLMVALFLPKLCFWHFKQAQEQPAQTHASNFKLGLENLPDTLFKSVDKAQKKVKPAIALITNQTGTDQEGNRNVDILAKKGMHITKILIPEGSDFGRATFQGSERRLDIPIITLHTKDNQPLFNKAILKDTNILMFDMQDSGVRHYGYVSMLLQAMQAARTYQKKFVVLDRPNLLGWCMEGASSDGLSHAGDSSIEQSIVPTRHGMTIGELATYFNKYVLGNPVDLHVVPMENYDRQTEARKPLMCGLSRNINNIDSCYGYSFLGLLGEVAPFEIGIGTDKAFQCLLLPEHLKFPKQKWHELRLLLNNHGIESKLYRHFSDRKKEYCAGLRLYIHDINQFSSFKTLLTVLNFFKQSGVKLTFSNQFDSALGTDKVRSLLQGSVKPEALALEINGDLQSFFKKAFSCFLYKPFPKMMHV